MTGTISEFVPSSDPLDPPSTQLTSPTVLQLSTGNPLPAPVTLTATFPDPAGPFDQLERVEHMRVSVASITVSGPSQGSINEVAATGTNNGRFHGVVTGVPRPFREAGIQAPDPPPSGSIPPIPRWDFNPERIRIDSAGLTGQAALTVRSGDVVGPIAGPLDYLSRAYAIQPDGTSTPVVTVGTLATTVSAAAGHEVTIASFNLQRFFDAVDDPGVDDSVLTPGAYDTRLSKASIAIRQHLRHPDIIAVQEVENLTALQNLAGTINGALGPQYDAHLVEGNDVSGLDVGFLVKRDDLSGGGPRVSVVAVAQQNAGELLVNPDSSTQSLWQRPPLLLEATVNRAGVAWPIVVIVVHPRTDVDIDSVQPGVSGWPTEGDRVRAIRQRQAESLANLVQARQSADPGEHLVVLGGFEALAANDGFVDVMNVIAGTPPPDNQTVVPGDGVDLVNPDLVNLVSTQPAERYSKVPDGNARAVDHVLVGSALVADTTARRIEYARIGADYPETDRNSSVTAFRLSDHDPVVAYLAVSSLLVADVAVSVADAPDPVTSGTSLTYTITVSNNGPDTAANVSLSDTLPVGTTFASLAAPGGWSCSTPAAGAGGTITCSNPSLSVGGGAVFTVTVAVAPSVTMGTVLSNAASVTSSTADPNSLNNSATATTAVAASADLTLVVVEAPDPVIVGHDIAYTVTVDEQRPEPGLVGDSHRCGAGQHDVRICVGSDRQRLDDQRSGSRRQWNRRLLEGLVRSGRNRGVPDRGAGRRRHRRRDRRDEHGDHRERGRGPGARKQRRRGHHDGRRCADHYRYRRPDDRRGHRDGGTAVHDCRRRNGGSRPHAVGLLVRSDARARCQHRLRRLGRQSHRHGHAGREPERRAGPRHDHRQRRRVIVERHVHRGGHGGQRPADDWRDRRSERDGQRHRRAAAHRRRRCRQSRGQASRSRPRRRIRRS